MTASRAARRKQPPPQAPVVQRVRIQYRKSGRMRFTSHRDFARALERALRRAQVPIAYSAGFNPHPRVSYSSAAPTGVASEAEYLELALQRSADPDDIAKQLDAALPPGLDVIRAVTAADREFSERLAGSRWRIELPGVSRAEAVAAVERLMAADEVIVTKMTKKGHRPVNARSAVRQASLLSTSASGDTECAILVVVVAHATPAVRPDDVLSALSAVAGMTPPVPPRVTRLAQGPFTESGDIADPLTAEDD